jgi:hypothetical protein
MLVEKMETLTRIGAFSGHGSDDEFDDEGDALPVKLKSDNYRPENLSFL